MKRQEGFSVGSAIMLFMLLVVIVLAGRYVSRANQDNQKQAGLLDQAFENGTDVSDSGSEEEKLALPEDETVEYPIRHVDVDVDVLQVTITAKLTQGITGDCTANVSLPDGSNKLRFTAEIDHSDVCIIYIPLTRLTAGKTWQFQTSFMSDDGKAKGDHPPSTFRL